MPTPLLSRIGLAGCSRRPSVENGPPPITPRPQTGGGRHDRSGRQSVETGRRPRADLSLPDEPAQLIRHAAEEHRRLDVLVNNAGAVQTPTEAFFGTSDEDFARRSLPTSAASPPAGSPTPEEVATLITYLAPDRQPTPPVPTTSSMVA